MNDSLIIFLRNLGLYFKRLRIHQRYSYLDVATPLNMQDSAVRRFEYGATDFCMSTLLKLCQFYEAPFEEFMKLYTELPTRQELKEVERQQKELTRWHKSKRRKPPQTGIQLKLKLETEKKRKKK